LERSPYEPPKTTVRDRLDLIAPKPPQIARAVRLLWAGVIASGISLLPVLRGRWWVEPGQTISAAQSLAFAMVVVTISFGIMISLMVLVGRRKNWARWVLLALLIVGWITAAIDMPQTLSATPFAGAIDFLVTIAELWATYLLFLSPGARWFKRQDG
jgi:hypothetical protein